MATDRTVGYVVDRLVRTQPLDIDACRAAWIRAMSSGRVDVRHIEDAPTQERARMASLGLDSACWPWLGSRVGRYGCVVLGGSQRYAHRVSFIAHSGSQIQSGLVIDHICERPDCVNPSHLQAVTPRINNRLAKNRAANAYRGPDMAPICNRGHAITGSNVKGSALRDNHLACRACNVAHAAANNRTRRYGWSASDEERERFVQVYADIKQIEYSADDCGDLILGFLLLTRREHTNDPWAIYHDGPIFQRNEAIDAGVSFVHNNNGYEYRLARVVLPEEDE